MPLQVDALALSIGAGAAAGLVGCFAVMRRMTLAADALSHVALPGIGLAVALRIHPAIGAFAMLLVGTLVVWMVERRTGLATEAIIGVVFSTALAVGSMTTSGEALIEALFGATRPLAPLELAGGLAVTAVIIAFVARARHALVLSLVSPDIARTAGIDVARLDLSFLLVFAATLAVGLRYLGVLLVGSLVIVPAATAKRLARNLSGMLAIAVAVAVASTLAGTFAASALHREAGPLVVVFAAAFFVLSLLFRL